MTNFKTIPLIILLLLSVTACNRDIVVLPDIYPSKEVNNSMMTAEEVQATQQESFENTDINEKAYIKEIFNEYGLKAGTCLSDYMIANLEYTDIIVKNFDSITFENLLKPDYILDKEASIANKKLTVKISSDTQSLLQWCRQNNMAVRGHTLIWHSQTPDWIFYEDFDTQKSLVSREVMLERMESYILQTFSQLEQLGYLELFYAYDVLNEAWMEDGSRRDTLWLKTIGEDYMWYAFYYADKYAPDYIDLYYNDYNERLKASAICDFVKTLVDKNGNYLIDGIGLQAHLFTKDSFNSYLSAVEKLGSVGLKVNLTELDVCLGSYDNPLSATDTNLKIQGKYYYYLINGILDLVKNKKVQMDSLTFWGFADNLSWRKEYSPLLFNENLEPKYAFYGVMQQKELAGFN